MLILEQDENRILAELVLSLVAKLTHDYWITLEQKAAEVMTIKIIIISSLVTHLFFIDTTKI